MERCSGVNLRHLGDDHFQQFKKAHQKHRAKIFGRHAFNEQQEAMEIRMRIPHCMTLLEGIEQTFRINEGVLFLGKEAESYTIKTMARKIIPKVLTGDALLEYTRRDGKSKTTEKDGINVIDDIDEYLKVKRKVENLQDCGPPHKKGQSNNWDKNCDKERAQVKSDKDEKKDGNKEMKNPCGIHDGKHEWYDCSNNKYGSNYKSVREAEKSKSKVTIKEATQAPTAQTFDFNDIELEEDDELAQSSKVSRGDIFTNEAQEEKSKKEHSLYPSTVVAIPK